MKIDNLSNYPDVGEFSNIAEPVHTIGGNTAFLVSNYNGLYGLVLGTILVFVTDNYPYAAQELAARKADPRGEVQDENSL